MNGLLFPGQGSQSVGMGMDIYEKYEPARIFLDKANEILDYDIKKLMFEGPQEVLTDTKFAQPAIYICSAMYLKKLQEKKIDYDYVAGHSLGEYSALLAAKVFSFEDGLKLVAARGKAMSMMNGKGTMAAVMGLTEEELQPYIVPGVVMANLNSKMQIVISGETEAVMSVGEGFKDNEEVKFRPLEVSAAFHSPQMEGPGKEMSQLINNTEFKSPVCNVISNVTGEPTKDIEEIRSNLINQITGQVRWYDTIIAMKKAGVKMLYEVGYGEVLKKMNKTITLRPKCVGVEV